MVGYAGSRTYTAYVDMTLTRSKVKVTGLLNFRQLAKPCMLAAMTAAPLRGFLVGPCLLWPNSWMNQDATWYGGMPRPKRHHVRWGPSFPQKGHSPPIFSPCLLWTNGRPSQLLLRSCFFIFQSKPKHPSDMFIYVLFSFIL